jgi:hypothetical protein
MIRTCDQRFRKPLLYPLSYEGERFILAVDSPTTNRPTSEVVLPQKTRKEAAAYVVRR